MTNGEFILLLAQLKKGNANALKRIYEGYFYRLYYTALGQVHNSQDAYDIAMTVIEKLWNYTGNPYEITNHVGLLVQMTKNSARDFLRKSNKIVNSDILPFVGSDKMHDNLWAEDILHILTSEEYKIFVDHIVWKKKLKELAKELNCSYASIKRRYAEIKNKIKDIYQN